MKNWRNAEEYEYTKSLSVLQWAWEFLRRNHLYIKDWTEFNNIETHLESTYGPWKDFPALWRADKRFYILDPPIKKGEDLETYKQRVEKMHSEGRCKKVTSTPFFSAYAKKWGLEYPIDPDQEVSEDGASLIWSVSGSQFTLLNRNSSRYFPEEEFSLGFDSPFIALGFDLNRSIDLQIKVAREYLLNAQKRLKDNGVVDFKSTKAPKLYSPGISTWYFYVRILDAKMDYLRPTNKEIFEVLGYSDNGAYGSSPDATIDNHYRKAKKLCENGYIDLVKNI